MKNTTAALIDLAMEQLELIKTLVHEDNEDYAKMIGTAIKTLKLATKNEAEA